jgi:hypothetical protein
MGPSSERRHSFGEEQELARRRRHAGRAKYTRSQRYNALVSAPPVNTRAPRWFWIPIRVFLVTLVMTLLSFAISLFLGIVGLVIGARIRGVPPKMPLAYRHIALPAAAVVGAVVWVSSIFMEIRHFRQSKALASIERAH